MPNDPRSDDSRAEARREQIRAAAEDCFRQYGFHGTSIAQISKAAGMSTGHIYHYFDNKEAIIADIVAQDLARLQEMTAQFRMAGDVRAAMIERAAGAVEDNLDPGRAALQVEIVAEAARNPHIAEIVRNADVACRDGLLEAIRRLRREAGHEDSEADLAGMVEAMAAMFEGLRIRAIRNPGLDRAAVVRVFRAMIHDLLSRSA
ncbi:MAG: TetR/AcrR family transcriptional regulator [Gallionellaceae bacterium]|nr:TetR/AcrR family transcriptional regulator [Gallionellaceae bacterium]